MQIQKIIKSIPSDQISFIPQTVTINGRSKTVEIATFKKSQGRPSKADEAYEQNIETYNSFIISGAEQQLKEEIAAEQQTQLNYKNQLEKEFEEKEQQLKERYSLVKSRAEKKKESFTKGIVRTGVMLLVLIGVFSFAINYINLHEFFGVTMADKFGGILSKFILIVVSLLISVSFAFFAVLRNGKMVKKTLWILPADLLLAFFISTGILNGAPEIATNVFKVLTCLIYVGQVYFIALEISNLFVGVGIENGREKEHYEKVFNSIFA